MRPTAGGVRISVAVQPELWPGRLLGEWTPQEHQQLTLALVTYGRDWQRARAMHVPSRSVDEARPLTSPPSFATTP